MTLHACFVDVTIPQVAEMCVLGEGRLAGKGDTRHVVVEGDDTAVQRGSHQQIGLRDERADPKDVHVGVHPDRHLLQAAAGHLWVLEVDEWATLAQADGGFRAPSHALNSQGPPPESVEQPSIQRIGPRRPSCRSVSPLDKAALLEQGVALPRGAWRP